MIPHELYDKVVNATGASDDLDYEITQVVSPGAIRHSSAHAHYTSSVDAVLALIERELPGAIYSVGRGPNHTKRKRKSDGARIPFDSFVANNDLIGDRSHKYGLTEGCTPSLALLAAFLLAKFRDQING